MWFSLLETFSSSFCWKTHTADLFNSGLNSHPSVCVIWHKQKYYWKTGLRVSHVTSIQVCSGPRLLWHLLGNSISAWKSFFTFGNTEKLTSAPQIIQISDDLLQVCLLLTISSWPWTSFPTLYWAVKIAKISSLFGKATSLLSTRQMQDRQAEDWSLFYISECCSWIISHIFCSTERTHKSSLMTWIHVYNCESSKQVIGNIFLSIERK